MPKTPSYREMIEAIEDSARWCGLRYSHPELTHEEIQDQKFKLGYVIGLLRRLQANDVQLVTVQERLAPR